MFAYPILVMTFLVSPQAHSSVSLSCPCNDTKGWGDCARECCLGIARLCCSKNPETEPLTKDRLLEQSLPKAEKKYSSPPVPTATASTEEMAVPPLPVPHPARGKPKTAAITGSEISGGDFSNISAEHAVLGSEIADANQSGSVSGSRISGGNFSGMKVSGGFVLGNRIGYK